MEFGDIWPEEKPDIPFDPQGWLGDDDKRMLRRMLNVKTECVIEIGSWLGKSTRFILEHAPRATVYAIDTWEGSPEHHDKPQWREKLATLYDSFLSNCWQYRARLVPLRVKSQFGLDVLASHGVAPDVVFIDGAHDFDSVLGDVALAYSLFPNARICGDDFEHGGVGRAVRRVCSTYGLKFDRIGNAWWIKK